MMACQTHTHTYTYAHAYRDTHTYTHTSLEEIELACVHACIGQFSEPLICELKTQSLLINAPKEPVTLTDQDCCCYFCDVKLAKEVFYQYVKRPVCVCVVWVCIWVYIIVTVCMNMDTMCQMWDDTETEINCFLPCMFSVCCGSVLFLSMSVCVCVLHYSWHRLSWLWRFSGKHIPLKETEAVFCFSEWR